MAAPTIPKPKPKPKPKGPAKPAASAFDEAMANVQDIDFGGEFDKFMSKTAKPVTQAVPDTKTDRNVLGGEVKTPAALRAEQSDGVEPWYNQRVGLSPGSFSAPSSAGQTTFVGGTDRKTSSRIIILAMGVGGVVIILQGAKGNVPAFTTADGQQVPGSLRAFAGLMVAGSVALLVNEAYPGLGLVMGVALLFVALGDGKVLTRMMDSVFGKPNTIRPASQTTTQYAPAPTSPGQSPTLGHVVQ